MNSQYERGKLLLTEQLAEDIAPGEKPCKLPLGHHGESLHIFIDHDGGDLSEALILRNTHNGSGHDLADLYLCNRSIGRLFPAFAVIGTDPDDVGEQVAEQIAVGYDAEDFALFAYHGNGLELVATHELKELENGSFRIDPEDALGHDVPNGESGLHHERGEFRDREHVLWG